MFIWYECSTRSGLPFLRRSYANPMPEMLPDSSPSESCWHVPGTSFTTLKENLLDDLND